MFRITKETSTNINELLASLRETDKDSALMARKVFGNIKTKEYSEVPATAKELTEYYNGKESQLSVLGACSRILESLMFIEIIEESTQDIEVPEIEVSEIEDTERFSFIANTAYADMTAHELTLVMFRDIGTEEEIKIVNMNTGLKLKLDLLDNLKDELVINHPNIRVE